PDEGMVEPGLIGGPAPGGRTAVLVGYGPRTTSAKRRPRAGAPAAAPTPEAAPPAPEAAPNGGSKVLAKPPVRKLARDLGVDLTALVGSGPQGSITRADVEAATSEAVTAAAPRTTGGEQRI